MRRLLAGAALLVLLTGCGGQLSPKDALQDQTAQLISAANAKSVTGVHSAAAALRDTIKNQVASGDLSNADADTLRKLVSDIENDAGLLTAASPTPTPSPSTSPTPSPTPSVSPTPSPTPTPSPSESPPSARPTFVTPPPTTEPPTIPATRGIVLGDPSPQAT